MDTSRPRFELTRVYDDGTSDEPEIVPLSKINREIKTARRGFLSTSLLLGVGISASALSSHVNSASTKNKLIKK